MIYRSSALHPVSHDRRLFETDAVRNPVAGGFPTLLTLAGHDLESCPPRTWSADHATKPAAIHTGQLVLRKVPLVAAAAMRAKMNMTRAARTNRRRMWVPFF